MTELYTITRVLVYEGSIDRITDAIERRGVKGCVRYAGQTIYEAPLGDLTPRLLRVPAATSREVEKARAWDRLMELCGSWQDGSQETVTLSQDDATHTAFIKVGKKQFYVEGQGFESAIKESAK